MKPPIPSSSKTPSLAYGESPKRRPGIGCAQITVSPREAPLEEAVGEGTETDSGKLEACERALVDKAECSTRNRRTYEPRPAPHRDQRGPAEEAATPSPSSSPAGDSGPLDPGNA
ncbi:Cyclic nucleotide-binding domain-containing protein [Trichinella pseudospiralis]